MFNLRVLQAEYGDCLIVEYGTAAAPRFLLVDGGPEGTFAEHLGPELRRIAANGGALDLIVLSHVDNDHVIGLLDLLAELGEQRANDSPPTIGGSALWHNSFSRTIGDGTDVEPRLRAAFAAAGAAAQVMAATGAAVSGIGEGNSLSRMALGLDFGVNKGFPKLICVDDSPAPVTLDNLTLHVVGPTRANLDELRREWLEWLDAHEDAVASGDPRVAANADKSVPNLSSIMLLAEADEKRLLLTGDGRSDHLLAGLRQAGFLGVGRELHVDVLKVAHHGSNRNATKRFFRTVTANTYVLSANGRDDNPDLATLIWIVEAAQAQGRSIELVLTNETPSLQKLLEEYDPSEFGYRTRVLSRDDDSIVVALAP